MSRRSVRVLLVLLALAAASAAAYRCFFNELTRQDVRASALAADRAADEALLILSELRASQHAYVAAGQGEAFWTTRAASLFDAIRTRVLQLDGAGTTAEMLDGIDRLAAADKRARDFLEEGQPLMAGDVIFTDARDLADAVNAQVAAVRAARARAVGAREAELIREQYLLAGGALGAWVFVALLLLPRAGVEAPASGILHVAPQPEMRSVTADPDLMLNRDLGEPPGAGRGSPAANAPQPPAVAPDHVDAVMAGGSAVPRSNAHATLDDLASLCGDLARLTDPASLNPLLERTAKVVEASGVILWMAGADHASLHPAASHGYDARLLSRLGPVEREAGNLTASVFRQGASHAVPASGGAPAALAVPIAGASGAIGVLSAELAPGADVPLAMARSAIVAAQLATLLGAPPAADAPADQQARRTAS